MTEEQIQQFELIKTPLTEPLLKYVRTLQQQQKQLINALQQFNDPQNWVEAWDGNYARLAWNGSGTPMHFAAFALQQVQGKET